MRIAGCVGPYSTLWTDDGADIAAVRQGAKRTYERRGCGAALPLWRPDFVLAVRHDARLVGGFAVQKLSGGQLEAGMAWSDCSGDVVGLRVSDILAANSIVALTLFEASEMSAWSSDHSSGLWMRSGARPVEPIHSRPWPNCAYSTIRMRWTAEDLGTAMDVHLLEVAYEQVLSQPGFSSSAVLLRIAIDHAYRRIAEDVGVA